MNETITVILEKAKDVVSKGELPKADQASMKQYGEEVVAWINTIVYCRQEKISEEEVRSTEVAKENIEAVDRAYQIVAKRDKILKGIFS